MAHALLCNAFRISKNESPASEVGQVPDLPARSARYRNR